MTSDAKFLNDFFHKYHPCLIQVLTEDRIEILDSGRILRLENITINDRGVVSCKLNLKSFPVHVNHTLEILGKWVLRNKDYY